MAEANLVFGLNSYRELCGLHFGGVTMTSSQLLLKCATRGAKHAMHVVAHVKEALRQDEELRAKGEASSFTECVRLNRITSLAQDRLAIRLKRFKMGATSRDNALDNSDDDTDPSTTATVKQERDESMDEEGEAVTDDTNELVSLNATSAALVPQKPKWVPESDFENSEDSDEEEEEFVETVVKPEPKVAPKKSKKAKVVRKKSNAAEDSEEEDTVVMESAD